MPVLNVILGVAAVIWLACSFYVVYMFAEEELQSRRNKRWRSSSRARHPSRLVRRDHTSTCSACGRFLGADPEQEKLVEHHTLYHSRPVGPEDTAWWSSQRRER